MRSMGSFLVLAILAPVSFAADAPVADALYPEHILRAIRDLDHPEFAVRESASDLLSETGFSAIPAVSMAAESGSPEASVRAFEVLKRLYGDGDERTFETVEHVLEKLKFSERLDVASRAERTFETGSETRQKRAIAQFERLGGIVHYSDKSFGDRQPLGRPTIDYVMLGRDWKGGEEGLRLLGRIEDIRLSITQLYIIRGIPISEETKSDLLAELPFLKIELRGPARLGIRGAHMNEGCVVIGVDPGSAAEMAGLKIRDEVIEIDGRPVESFEKLIEIIGEKEPGDEVPVAFRRGEETHRVVAKLQAWTRPAAPNVPAPRP